MMKKILSEKVYRALLEKHRALGRELRSKSRLRFGKTIDSIERMQDLITRYGSWEGRKTRCES
jgi:hypothetical protein